MFSTLEDLLMVRKTLQEHEVRYFGRQLVEGMAYLHGLNLIHGDTKPLNLMLTKGMALKIGDFGGQIGSYGYQAPEALQHQKHTQALDIWALGGIFYRMLVGVCYKPSRGKGKQMRTVPVHQPTLSKYANDLLSKTLHTSPDSRWKCAQLLQHPFFTSGALPELMTWESFQKVAPAQGGAVEQEHKESPAGTKFSTKGDDKMDARNKAVGPKEEEQVEGDLDSLDLDEVFNRVEEAKRHKIEEAAVKVEETTEVKSLAQKEAGAPAKKPGRRMRRTMRSRGLTSRRSTSPCRPR
ncbi:Inactive serine/threonine-protein kinase plk5 [Mortierella sp. 14UC]|nr:Inactive serine/threonine-protein kinase plk5 [Mortierella sp. 14UC]